MTIDEQIEVMQHFRDGGEVEHLIEGNWIEVDYPIWDFLMTEYRKKPEKKTRLMTAEELFRKTIKSKDGILQRLDVVQSKTNQIFGMKDGKFVWVHASFFADNGWVLEDGSPLTVEVD